VKYSLNAAMWFGGMDLTKLVWKLNGTTDQPAGLIHNPDTKRYAVTFVDNHDTYRNNDKFTGNVLAAYAFLMGSPGVPCVFLPHWNANKPAISDMIAARRAVQLHSESAVTVNQSGTDIYVATIAGLSGTMIVKIGSGSYTAPTDYTLATSGTDYAIWTKISTMAPFLSVSPSGGTYYSHQTVTLTASTGADIFYTTNNTASTTASTLYTIPLDISDNTTLRAVAYNPTTQLYSDEAVNTYIISTFPTSLTLRFKIPVGWTACNIYSWTSSGTLTAGWPGNAMTLESDGTYSYSVTGFTTLPIGIVFNNGAGSSQTVDLFASGNICWEAAGSSDGKYMATEVICLGTSVKKTG
jgi:alpha-amylase